jgi:hypothetical protein
MESSAISSDKLNHICDKYMSSIVSVPQGGLPRFSSGFVHYIQEFIAFGRLPAAGILNQ